YRKGKPDASPEHIDALFARLDSDIATLRADAAAKPAPAGEAAAQQVAALEKERRDLREAWISARLARLGATAGEALRGLGESIGRGLEDAGKRLQESTRDTRPAAPGD